LSAFLLFQVQPLIGKFVLPWFGGTPSVWTTCMLFFQLLLFGGYAYAHLTTSWLAPRVQSVLHVVLLGAACLALPIIPSDLLKPMGTEEPILRIVLVLGATVGAPFFYSVGHGAPVAGLVQSHASEPLSVPALRALERGVSVGPDHLSDRVRMAAADALPGLDVVGQFCRVRDFVRDLRLGVRGPRPSRFSAAG
jgi:hypothetical protein